MQDTFSVVFEEDGEWLIGYVEELPGAHPPGAILDEARESLKEAIQLVIEVNNELARQGMGPKSADSQGG